MPRLTLKTELNHPEPIFKIRGVGETESTIGLLCQARMMDDDECEAVGGKKIGSEAEKLGENLPQYNFVHSNSHMILLGIKLRPPR
jgi:hypothetical protein